MSSGNEAGPPPISPSRHPWILLQRPPHYVSAMVSLFVNRTKISEIYFPNYQAILLFEFEILTGIRFTFEAKKHEFEYLPSDCQVVSLMVSKTICRRSTKFDVNLTRNKRVTYVEFQTLENFQCRVKIIWILFFRFFPNRNIEFAVNVTYKVPGPQNSRNLCYIQSANF